MELNLHSPIRLHSTQVKYYVYISEYKRFSTINKSLFITFQCVFIGVRSVIPAGAGLTRSCNTLGNPTNV
jgi:hypothetical protein